jgi:FAD:protein FMN transferase
VEQIMGMPISVHVRGPGVATAMVERLVGDLFDQVRRADALFSTWRADSEISRIQRGDLDLADADPLVREVAHLCDLARDRTDGWFDADLPDGSGARRFDPTGLVKGWAVERAGRGLVTLRDHDVLINAGGDIVVACDRVDTPAWEIGVEDPADRTRLLARVPLRSGAVATSGTAARGAHIVDPQTGRAVAQFRSVTVIGPSLLWADVYATAAFARGADAPDWLRTLRDHVALVVDRDGTTTTVTGRG